MPIKSFTPPNNDPSRCELFDTMKGAMPQVDFKDAILYQEAQNQCARLACMVREHCLALLRRVKSDF